MHLTTEEISLIFLQTTSIRAPELESYIRDTSIGAAEVQERRNDSDRSYLVG